MCGAPWGSNLAHTLEPSPHGGKAWTLRVLQCRSGERSPVLGFPDPGRAADPGGRGGRSGCVYLTKRGAGKRLGTRATKPVHPEGHQPRIFTGRADAEAEAPVPWPPDAKSRLAGNDPDAGEDWGQEKGTTEDGTVGWHHQLSGHELEQAPGDGDGQGGLECCGPWGGRESDTTERLNSYNHE